MNQTLTEKLELKAGQKLVVLNASTEVMDFLRENLPENDLTTTTTVKGDGVIFFASTFYEVESLAPHAFETLLPGGVFWIAYPKGESAKITDIDHDRLANALQPTGWLPVQQIALDDTWLAMRFAPQEKVG